MENEILEMVSPVLDEVSSITNTYRALLENVILEIVAMKVGFQGASLSGYHTSLECKMLR